MTEEKTMRLNQAAKTLNIGISSVVEFLTLKGFEIENKPTAKITQEQFKLLLKAFESSVADKLEALEKKKTPEPEIKKPKEAEPETPAKPRAPGSPPKAPALPMPATAWPPRELWSPSKREPMSGPSTDGVSPARTSRGPPTSTPRHPTRC